jgi:hypothetical protein
MDGHGQASTDPAVLFQEPKGTILPLGGMDSGHKGYGLSLMVEAFTGGLAGHGRADLAEAVETALRQLHNDEAAPARVFVRDSQGTQVITTSDPCTTYGSQAIVRS